MTKPKQFVITRVVLAHKTVVEFYSCSTAKWSAGKEQATHFAHEGEATAVASYLVYHDQTRKIVVEAV